MAADNTEDEILGPSDLGRKLVIALRSVTDPQALMQAIADRSVSALKAEFSVRLSASEDAQKLFHEDLVRVPTAVDRAIQNLQALIESKFIGAKALEESSAKQRDLIRHESDEAINALRWLHEQRFIALEEALGVFKQTISDRFALNDQQTEKAFNAAKQAVNEQNNANAQAVTKSEANVAKSIDDIRSSLKTLAENTENRIGLNKTAVDDKVNDLKDRIATLETRLVGGESKASVTDPSTLMKLAELQHNVSSLRESRAGGEGGSQATGNTWAIIAGVIAALWAISGTIVAIIEISKR